ncbi:MAG: threonine ammonia-lyase [bacterium]|nr:threonine ammonia-lyase [bacterium]
MISLERIKEARALLTQIVHKTPLVYSTTLSEWVSNPIYLKCENFQKTGSFKVRGAYFKISQLSNDEKRRGIIACSAGNHAQGVAYSSSKLGIDSVIVMPEFASISKIEATKGYGGRVILYGKTFDEAQERAIEMIRETGRTFISPYDDPEIIAGQGTIALEILEQLPDVDIIVVPVGGGGLISGIASVVKSINPKVKIIGVQTKAVPSVYNAISKGKIEEITYETIADGIAVKNPGKITLEIISKLVDDIVLVDEEEIAGAILFLMERCKMIVEGAGAVSVSSILYEKIPLKGNTVAILSGGNIDVNLISIIIEHGLTKSGRRLKFITTIPDRPGELHKLLTIIAKIGANIISIHHERLNPIVPIGMVEVEISVETRSKEHSEELISAIKSAGYKLSLI